LTRVITALGAGSASRSSYNSAKAREAGRGAAKGDALKKYMCLICGFIYEEEFGLPDEGIPPGTTWDKVPPNWTCPECGARKDDFEMVEF
jgi:rubredoxin